MLPPNKTTLAVSTIDLRARLLPLDDVLAKTYDPYAFIRSAFDQRRRFQIYDGNVPEELLQEDDAGEDMDDTGDEATEDAPPAEPPPGVAVGAANSSIKETGFGCGAEAEEFTSLDSNTCSLSNASNWVYQTAASTNASCGIKPISSL